MPRFVIAKPVPGGDENFELTDTADNLTLITMHKSVYESEMVISRIADMMNDRYPNADSGRWDGLK